MTVLWHGEEDLNIVHVVIYEWLHMVIYHVHAWSNPIGTEIQTYIRIDRQAKKFP